MTLVVDMRPNIRSLEITPMRKYIELLVHDQITQGFDMLNANTPTAGMVMHAME
jgi:hypothetical protein